MCEVSVIAFEPSQFYERFATAEFPTFATDSGVARSTTEFQRDSVVQPRVGSSRQPAAFQIAARFEKPSTNLPNTLSLPLTGQLGNDDSTLGSTPISVHPVFGFSANYACVYFNEQDDRRRISGVTSFQVANVSKLDLPYAAGPFFNGYARAVCISIGEHVAHGNLSGH